MDRYTEIIGDVSPATRRVHDVVAALAPPARPSSPSALAKRGPGGGGKSLTEVAKKAVPGLVGAVAGYMYWKRHPILGAILGHAVGSNAMAVVQGGPARTKALLDFAVEGAAVVGSLKWKRHPVLGFIAGGVAGAAATAVVSDNAPAREAWDKLKARW